MANIPIALQLYSVREDAARDLPGVLKQVAEMGYQGVEFAGWYGHDAATIKKMLDDNGLQVAGAHVAIDTMLGDELEKSIEFHQSLGNRYLIVPYLGEKWRSPTSAWIETARTLSEIGEKLKPHGMQTGYHNHDFEFKPAEPGGELLWDLFFSNASPDVIMQFDTGNALHGGAETLPYLQRFPGRAVTVHLKEHDPDNDKALVGEGKVPWQALFEEIEKQGATKWYIVEQESYPYSPLESAKRCLDNLRGMGK